MAAGIAAMKQPMMDKFLRLLPLLATAALACSAPVAGGAKTGARVAGDGLVHATPALWAVRDADTTIYLFGTVHMLKADVRWFEGDVKAAFDSADTLVIEVSQDDPAKLAAAFARLAASDGGPPVSQSLTPKQSARYAAALKTYHIPAEAMDRVDPWLVAINPSVAPLMQLGYQQDLGADKVLEQAARQSGKTVVGLESAEEQLGIFDALPRTVQIDYLNATIEGLPEAEKEFATLIRNWSRGRADALAKQMNESLKDTPELAKPLLLDRNARWAAWIEKRMDQPGTVFIAVGAGHLAGKGSVIELLKGRRLVAQRVEAAAEH
jgi:uncharacterized protein YbaP (TraB family)